MRSEHREGNGLGCSVDDYKLDTLDSCVPPGNSDCSWLRNDHVTKLNENLLEGKEYGGGGVEGLYNKPSICTI